MERNPTPSCGEEKRAPNKKCSPADGRGVLTLNAARPRPGERVQPGEVRGGLAEHAGALPGHIEEGSRNQPQSLHTVEHAQITAAEEKNSQLLLKFCSRAEREQLPGK